MEATIESRVQWLEQCVIQLQNQINWMKNNPTATVGGSGGGCAGDSKGEVIEEYLRTISK